MKIGLFFGSFNPIHVGHLVIAEHMASRTDLDQIWLVVSPHNPLKDKSSLANDYDRLHLVNMAIDDNDNLRSSNIEFGLPKPSYTVDTLEYLKEKHPSHDFSLIMGGDNIASLHKWKNYERLIENYRIFVYKRPGFEFPTNLANANIEVVEAPMMNISASFIRKSIKEGKSVRYLLHPAVLEQIEKSTLYR